MSPCVGALSRDTLVYEVKLGDEFLMSSLFTVGETALADLGLAWLQDSSLDVVVGGLGLGYTAVAALKDARVRELVVIELLGTVIEWHRKALVPLGATLTADPRCRLVNADFFQAATGDAQGFDFDQPARRFDAILLDVDHSTEHLLSDGNAAFYSHQGLAAMQRFIVPGGVFAMWSNDPPEAKFIDHLQQAFVQVDAQVVEFENPYSGGTSSCTI